MSKQALYLAKTNKCFKKPNIWGFDEENCTAIEKLAHLINSSWKHSMYWPFDDDKKLLPEIEQSLNTEIDHAHNRLAELIEAKKILNNIELPKDNGHE